MFDVAHLTLEDFKQLVLAARLTSIMNPAVNFEHNLDILWMELQKYYGNNMWHIALFCWDRRVKSLTNRFGTMMFDGGPACPCRSACCCKEYFVKDTSPRVYYITTDKFGRYRIASINIAGVLHISRIACYNYDKAATYLESKIKRYCLVPLTDEEQIKCLQSHLYKRYGSEGPLGIGWND